MRGCQGEGSGAADLKCDRYAVTSLSTSGNTRILATRKPASSRGGKVSRPRCSSKRELTASQMSRTNLSDLRKLQSVKRHRALV
jgi:hypothetical protein